MLENFVIMHLHNIIDNYVVVVTMFIMHACIGVGSSIYIGLTIMILYGYVHEDNIKIAYHVVSSKYDLCMTTHR